MVSLFLYFKIESMGLLTALIKRSPILLSVILIHCSTFLAVQRLQAGLAIHQTVDYQKVFDCVVVWVINLSYLFAFVYTLILIIGLRP